MTRRQVDLCCLLAIFVIGQLVTGLLFSLPLEPIKSPDSGSYMSAAANFPHSVGGSYSGYVGFIGLMRLAIILGSGPNVLIAFNCLGVLAASAALLSIGRRYSGETAGWSAAAFYLLHPLINQWTRYVLTETLFYAGVAITAFCVMRAIDLNRWSWAPLWLVAGVTSSFRPNGIVLLGAVVTILTLSNRPRIARHLLGVVAAWSVVLALAILSPSLTAAHGDFASEAWKGTVVHGVPDTSIAMPEPTSNDSSNAAFIAYGLEHPVDLAKLGATRVWWEMKQVRPWYSQELNLFLTISMATLYLFALIGAWRSRRTGLNLIVLSISIPFCIVIAGTWAIWEGRFGWWFLVLWTTWAGIGVSSVIDPVINRLPDQHFLRRFTSRSLGSTTERMGP